MACSPAGDKKIFVATENKITSLNLADYVTILIIKFAYI